MNKQTYKQLDSTFEQLDSTFEQLSHVLDEMLTELEKAKLNSSDAKEQIPEDPCNEDHICEDSEISMTPLEELISIRIDKHLKEDTFPSLEEAQIMYILDSINYRYNK